MRANLGRLSTHESLWEAWRDPIRVLIRVLHIPGRRTSAATVGDPIAEVPLAQVATGDGADDAVGLIRITERWDPRSAVALHELDGGQERAALNAIRSGWFLTRCQHRTAAFVAKSG